LILNDIALESLELHFDNLKDPRRATKNMRHNFMDIIVIAICGTICGANNYTSIVAYAKSKEDWLRTFLELPSGIPSHDTFNDVFMKLDSEVFEKCFISWVSSFLDSLPDDVISIDGKTLRRSHDNANSKRAIHIVSAWSTNNALVLGQVKTEEKSNEITAIPELLDVLDIKKCLITIDAMGCQKKIAEKVISKDGDYLLAVKDNQKNLYDAIKQVVFDVSEDEFNVNFSKFYENKSKGHGRVEERRCWVCSDISIVNMDLSEWKNIKSFVYIESTRTINGKSTTEYRIYISSNKKSAQYFLNASRNHWHIENKLHWILDVAFREDESRLRKGNGAENFSILRRIALNLLKKEKTDKTGVETKRLRSGWDNDYLKIVLSGMLT
jgi:predicted transposase YbfD/YdcC